MNQFLPSRFDEDVRRLALGIEAIDAQRAARIPFPIQVTFDQVPLGLPRPKVVRHNSCVFVLLYQRGVDDRVELRLFDGTAPVWRPEIDQRRFVPRRLRIPLLSEDDAERRPYAHRIRRPALFPGSAYDVSESVTGLRGRVERNGQAVRWARVLATHPDSGLAVGRAHCDDRGEFLLLIEASAAPIGDLTNPLVLDLRAHVPNPPAEPVAEEMKKKDPLWDLPLEEVPDPGQPDPVCAGDPPWNRWSAADETTSVSFSLGRLHRQQPPLTVQ